MRFGTSAPSWVDRQRNFKNRRATVSELVVGAQFNVGKLEEQD